MNELSQTNQPTTQMPVYQNDDIKKQNQLLKVALSFMFIFILILSGAVAYLFTQKKTVETQEEPTARIGSNTQPSSLPTTLPSPVVKQSPDANTLKDWVTYKDDQNNYSFQHPARYKRQKPVGEAEPDGEAVFYAKSKADMFFIDVTKFTGSLEAFIQKYTTFDSSMKANVVTLNITSPLGEMETHVKLANTEVTFYKHVNHYDQSVNPGAIDIISYTGFFIIGNNGYILRLNNSTDKLIELTDMISTFK